MPNAPHLRFAFVVILSLSLLLPASRKASAAVSYTNVRVFRGCAITLMAAAAIGLLALRPARKEASKPAQSVLATQEEESDEVWIPGVPIVVPPSSHSAESNRMILELARGTSGAPFLVNGLPEGKKIRSFPHLLFIPKIEGCGECDTKFFGAQLTNWTLVDGSRFDVSDLKTSGVTGLNLASLLSLQEFRKGLDYLHDLQSSENGRPASVASYELAFGHFQDATKRILLFSKYWEESVAGRAKAGEANFDERVVSTFDRILKNDKSVTEKDYQFLAASPGFFQLINQIRLDTLKSLEDAADIDPETKRNWHRLYKEMPKDIGRPSDRLTYQYLFDLQYNELVMAGIVASAYVEAVKAGKNLEVHTSVEHAVRLSRLLELSLKKTLGDDAKDLVQLSKSRILGHDHTKFLMSHPVALKMVSVVIEDEFPLQGPFRKFEDLNEK